MFSPLKLLSDASSRYAEKTKQNWRLVREDIPRLGEMLLHTKGCRWRSDYFDKSAGVHPERAQEVVDHVFYDKKARKELKRAIDALGGGGASAFWDVYLRRSVNSVLGFSEEYLGLLKLAHSALPTQGTLVDWNCGTGNLASALLLAAPERNVILADANPRAIAAAKRLLRYFFPSGGNFATKIGDPGAPGFKTDAIDGAILTNTLFLLENDNSKIECLQAVARHLREDGILLLVEPKPSLQKQSVLRHWLSRLVYSATRGYSPANEYDIALFTEVQRRLFNEATTDFSTTKELVSLCRQAGFAVNLVRDVLHGHYSALVLRKLPEVKEPAFEPVIRYHDEPYPE
jgi:SAM-dependent methyltransferase